MLEDRRLPEAFDAKWKSEISWRMTKWPGTTMPMTRGNQVAKNLNECHDVYVLLMMKRNTTRSY
jgi:hypothetical protein